MRYPTEFGKNCWMADYRNALCRAARMLRVSRLLEASHPEDAEALYTEFLSAFRATRHYKERILLFNSFVPWTDESGKEESV